MKALILVDLQNDFCPGGALPVADGDQVIPVANRLQDHFELVVATQDWHPEGHGSFAASHPGKRPGEVVELGGLEQILWPVHCVQNTPGAALVDDLHTEKIAMIFFKGIDAEVDSYSAFFDNAHRRATGLGDFLQGRGVTDLYIAGLATDYCVKFSVLDALGLGCRVFVVEDACRGVDLEPGDVERALAEMQEAGARIVCSAEVLEGRA